MVGSPMREGEGEGRRERERESREGRSLRQTCAWFAIGLRWVAPFLSTLEDRPSRGFSEDLRLLPR